MGPWAEDDKDKKDKIPSYYYPPLTLRPNRWYETWTAALVFTLLLLIFILAFCTGVGYLLQ